MFSTIRTWWQESRVVRKFRRDTAAMISLAVIGVYAAVFLWTVITPLDVDYVNLQQRKIGEFKEHRNTVKDLTLKGKALQAQIEVLLKKASPQQAKKAKKAKKAAPKKAAAPKPAPRKAAAKVPAKAAPKAAAPTKPAPRKAAAQPPTSQQATAPGMKKIMEGLKNRKAELDTFIKRTMASEASKKAKREAAEKAAAERLKHLRLVVMLQQQLGALERERMMAQIKLQRPAPKSLGWLSRYNQDTGQAYARPTWRGPNLEETTILAMVMPEVPMGKAWVKQSILGHGRRGPLGSDRLGRNIFKRVLVSINVAFKIGLVTALIACFIGLILGGIAGFFGGWIDLFITWVYSVFSAVPYIVLVLLIAAIFRDSSGLIGLYVAFGATFWIGPARVVRGEVMKIKQMEYVQAAWILGNSRMRILFRHVLPNTMHLIFVYFSLIFIGAIKSEVILTFLGLGVKNMPSWGGMISDASKEIIGGFWWQMIGASLALFFLVYAFNIFTDALQDALDPKHTK